MRARGRSHVGAVLLGDGVGTGTARRRRGRRSGPLTRLRESTLSRRDRRSSRPMRRRALVAAGHLAASHPTAEPCLPARAGVRGLAPGWPPALNPRTAPASRLRLRGRSGSTGWCARRQPAATPVASGLNPRRQGVVRRRLPGRPRLLLRLGSVHAPPHALLVLDRQRLLSLGEQPDREFASVAQHRHLTVEALAYCHRCATQLVAPAVPVTWSRCSAACRGAPTPDPPRRTCGSGAPAA